MEYFFVENNRYRLDGGAMFGHIPRALWSRWVQPDGRNRIPLASRCLVLRDERRTILFETGIGHYMEQKYAERFGIEGNAGCLCSELKQHGVQPDAVTHVILSHLHFDHAGGLVPDWPAVNDAAWQPLFSNAAYCVGEVQFERAKSPHIRDRASYIPGLREKLTQTGRLHLVKKGEPAPADLADIVSFRFTHGHTPGLMHALIHHDSSPLFFASDLIPGTAWVHLPVTMGYDRFPEQLVDEKKAVLECAARENWLVVYTHDPVVYASFILYNEEEKRFQTCKEQPTPGSGISGR